MIKKNIAMVHHCDYSSDVMTDSGYWFVVPDGIDIKEGDFVVTENFFQGKKTRNLCLGFVALTSNTHIEGMKPEDFPKMMVVSRVVASGAVYPKPIFARDFGKEDE